MAPGRGIPPALSRALFAPRAVALVGASGDPAKNTARPLRYLRRHGYKGEVFPINPSRSEVLGLAAYKNLRDVQQQIDHAFIMVEDVEAALEDCGARRVPVATIYSDGFADAGAGGAKRQARLVRRARELGVRLLGPNSMGVIDLPGHVALTINAVLEMEAPPAGATSLVSQSGTMLGTLLSRGAARGLGFAKLASVGNECDLGVAELVELLAADRDTRVILLFLETVRDPAALAAAARRAYAAGKPVVAYKLGRSALGAELARSHTGALAGSDRAIDAFFRDCGILRVDMLEALLEIAPLLSGKRPLQLKRAPRVSVVTTTGGGAAAVVDRLGLHGIETAAPDSDARIVDLTMAATSDSYGKTLAKLLAWPGCDAVLAAVGSSAQFHPELAIHPISNAAKSTKPLAVFMTPHAERSLALLAARGVAAFRTPEACADAFAAYFKWRAPRKAPRLKAPAFHRDAFYLFKTLGIPVAQQQIARAPAFRHSVPYPVALKMPGLEHKTEHGGVVLGVSDEHSLKKKISLWKTKAVLIQKMEKGLAEAIVGYRDDPVAGPVVMVGAGGVLAELYGDFALRAAPVSEREALEMIGEVKGLAPIRGYRKLPRGDVKALARAIANFSRLSLIANRPVAEAEINPLIVKARGVVAVDGLVVRKE